MNLEIEKTRAIENSVCRVLCQKAFYALLLGQISQKRFRSRVNAVNIAFDQFFQSRLAV